MSDPASPPKIEPEGLVLRGKPRRVTRFRRNVIIGAAAALTLVISGAALLALRAPSLKIKANGDELYNTDAKPAADQVASLPSNYDKVKPPLLGPPLPGDLGAPIVAREKSLGMNPSLGAFGTRGEEDADRAEHLRQAQLAQQAREAKVMFQTSSGGHLEISSTAQPSTSPPPTTGQSTSLARADDQNGQQHKLDFAKHLDDSGVYNSREVMSPASPYELLAGTIIPASLITGFNSDLPGLVIAQVTQDLCDLTCNNVLLPRGSRLLGKYDSVVAFGQSRALVVWQRIVMPNGSSIEIDNMPATDTEGYAGLEDEVDYHTWRLLKGIALSTLLGVGTQLSVGDNNDDLLTALRESAQSSANQAGQQITQRNLALQPTITIRPGFSLRVVLSKDLVLPPYRG